MTGQVAEEASRSLVPENSGHAHFSVSEPPNWAREDRTTIARVNAEVKPGLHTGLSHSGSVPVRSHLAASAKCVASSGPTDSPAPCPSKPTCSTASPRTHAHRTGGAPRLGAPRRGHQHPLLPDRPQHQVQPDLPGCTLWHGPRWKPSACASCADSPPGYRPWPPSRSRSTLDYLATFSWAPLSAPSWPCARLRDIVGVFVLALLASAGAASCET